jgi:hypothetical protein
MNQSIRRCRNFRGRWCTWPPPLRKAADRPYPTCCLPKTSAFFVRICLYFMDKSVGYNPSHDLMYLVVLCDGVRSGCCHYPRIVVYGLKRRTNRNLWKVALPNTISESFVMTESHWDFIVAIFCCLNCHNLS